MTATDRVVDYLEQMRRATNDAIDFTRNMDWSAFESDLRTQRAVIMSLMIVGEAANQVLLRNPAFAERNAVIPWHAMRGMRNRIAHGYFEMDLAVVWRTVMAELPTLAERLKALADNAQG